MTQQREKSLTPPQPPATTLDWVPVPEDSKTPSRARPGERSATPPLFVPGEIVAERFRILSFLGQGGMGQVFAAHDRELGTRVALKVIRPDIARSAQAVDRFKQEVDLARRVTHPNVCRVFDLSWHRGTRAADWGQSSEPILLLTMELLTGQSLGHRLADGPALTPATVLRLGRQLAAGLEAAHRADVIHRDLKPDNIILVGSGAEARAVITDFGVATATRGSGGSLAKGKAVGTPGYQAPEQRDGGPIGPKADLYALGLTLRGMTGEESGGSRAGESQLLDELIEHCLEEDPADRPESATAVLRALAAGSVSGPRASPRSSVVLTVLALIALAGLAVVTNLASTAREATPSGLERIVTAVPRRPILTVMAFETESSRGERPRDSIAAAAQRTMVTLLTGSERIRPRLGGSPPAPPWLHGSLPALAPNTVVGSGSGDSAYRLEGELIFERERTRWIARLFAGGTPEPQAVWEVEADRGDRRSAIGRLLEAGPNLLTPTASSSAELGLPQTDDLRALYAKAITAQKRGDGERARDLLLEVLAQAPEATAARASLAEVWWLLGWERRAAAAAERAAEETPDRSPGQHLRRRARAAELAGNQEQARQLYRQLWNTEVDDPSLGLKILALELRAVGSREAAETLAELRARGFAPSFAHQIDLAEAWLAWVRGDRETQAVVAARAARVAASAKEHRVAAVANLLMADALAELGRGDESRAALHLALAAFEPQREDLALAMLPIHRSVGSRIDPGFPPADAAELLEGRSRMREALIYQARVARIALRRQGNAPKIRDSLVESLEVARRLGSESAEAAILNALAVAEYRSDNFQAAAERFDEAVIAARATGDLELQAGYLQNAAQAQGNLHQKGEAYDRFEEALVVTRRLGSPRPLVFVLIHFGTVCLRVGEAEKAGLLLEEARELSLELGNDGLHRMATERLAEVRAMQDRLDEAESLIMNAIDHDDAAGGLGDGDRNRIFWILIELDGGEPETALAELDAVLARLPARMWYAKALAHQGRSLALLKSGRTEQARAAVRAARDEIAGRSVRDLNAELVQSEARIDAAVGQVDRAVYALQELQAEIAGSGDRVLELLVRRDLGLVLIAGGRIEPGLAHLRAVSEESRQLGFFRLARLAEKAAHEARVPANAR